MRIRDGKNLDPGWKKFGSRIRDKHPGSATLVSTTIASAALTCLILVILGNLANLLDILEGIV
jgi:hypothetical protein